MIRRNFAWFSQGVSRVSGEYGKEFLGFGLSTLCSYLLKLVAMVGVARHLGPANYGIWNALNLLLIYSAVAHFGLQNGMNRQIPFFAGKQQPEMIEKITSTSFLFTLGSSLFFSACLLLLANSELIAAEIRNYLIPMAGLFFSWQMYQFYQFILKSQIKFSVMSVQQVVFSLLQVVIVLPFTRWFQLNGFIIAQAVTTIATCILIHALAKTKFSLSFSLPVVKMLLKTGFPIMLSGILFSILISLDRFFILSNFSLEKLGDYSLAILCLGFFSLFPSVISQQMYPRMVKRFGETGKVRALVSMVWQQALLSEVIVLPLLLVVYISLPVLIRWLLPQYGAGLESARIILLAVAFLALPNAIGNLLNTIGKQVTYALSQGLGILSSVLYMFIFTRLFSMEISSVAWGLSLGILTYTLFLFAVFLLVIARNTDFNDHINEGLVSASAHFSALFQKMSLARDTDFHGINLIDSAVLLAEDEAGSGGGNRISFLQSIWMVPCTILRALFMPLIQKALSLLVSPWSKPFSGSNDEIAFVGFAQNHTEALLPVIRKYAHQNASKIIYLRGAINHRVFRERQAIPSGVDYLCLDVLSDAHILWSQFVYTLIRVAYYSVAIIRYQGEIARASAACGISRFHLGFHLYKGLVYYVPVAHLMLLQSHKLLEHPIKALVFGYDNCPRGRTLIQLARKKGIATIAVQHGAIAKVANYIPYADIEAVWTEQDKQRILAAGVSEERLQVTGSPKHDLAPVGVRPQRSAEFGVVFATTRGIPFEKTARSINLISRCLAPLERYKLIVRPHPLEDHRKYASLLRKPGMEHVEICSRVPFESLLSQCSLGIVFYSTVVIDFMLHGIPVATLLEHPDQDPTGMAKYKAIHRAPTEQDLSRLITDLYTSQFDWREFDHNRTEFLRHYFGNSTGSVGRIMGLIECRKAAQISL